MARVVKILQVPLTRLSTNGMTHDFAFPAEAGPHFLIPEGWKAELA